MVFISQQVYDYVFLFFLNRSMVFISQQVYDYVFLFFLNRSMVFISQQVYDFCFFNFSVVLRFFISHPDCFRTCGFREFSWFRRVVKMFLLLLFVVFVCCFLCRQVLKVLWERDVAPWYKSVRLWWNRSLDRSFIDLFLVPASAPRLV